MKKEKGKNSVKSIKRLGDTLIIVSNVFFIIAALISYRKHPILGILFLLIAVISAIHHSGWNILLGEAAWGKIDVVFAIGGSFFIFVYGLYYIHRNSHLEVFGTQRTFLIWLCSIIISVLAMGMLIAAKCPHTTNKECYTIQYLIYHSIWHILAGITGMFYAVLLMVD
jgi:hypothetical protein